jgi:hypothetical protein
VQQREFAAVQASESAAHRTQQDGSQDVDRPSGPGAARVSVIHEESEKVI